MSGSLSGLAPAETIAALSTAAGEGAIALVRVSGPQAIALVAPLFSGARRVEEMASHRQHFGHLHAAGQKLDEVLLSVHRAPRSYTGEDVVEIACHGGVLISRRVLEALFRAGARPAEPGEFTQRAFLHGKLDLTQAEAVMDLITAQSDRALASAQAQLDGGLGQRLQLLRDQVLAFLAHLEAYIDFPDEDLSPDTGAAMEARLSEIHREVQAMLATAERGRILREGVRTVIFGPPNVGKSSLLNLLLGYDRAIVSAYPGTTRDSLEETVVVRGLPIRLIDTAGVRASTDEIEQAGIARTLRHAGQAELVLHLQDASQPPSGEIAPVAERALLVLNKIDLGEHPAWSGQAGVRLSCREPRGVPALEAAIEHRLLGTSSLPGSPAGEIAVNARHRALLEQALAFIEQAQAGLRQGAPPEFVAEEVRAALDAIGFIAGRVESDDVLGRIFSTFCIGK